MYEVSQVPLPKAYVKNGNDRHCHVTGEIGDCCGECNCRYVTKQIQHACYRAGATEALEFGDEVSTEFSADRSWRAGAVPLAPALVLKSHHFVFQLW